MTETQDILPAETAGTAVTRFNALKQGVLSRYTVLSWEDVDEYRVQASSLADEHRPQGPTEEHLVEELAGWPLGREISGHRTELAAQLGTRLALLCLPPRRYAELSTPQTPSSRSTPRSGALSAPAATSPVTRPPRSCYISFSIHAAEAWKRPPREWFEAKTQFAVIFGERFVNV